MSKELERIIEQLERLALSDEIELPETFLIVCAIEELQLALDTLAERNRQ